MDDGWIERERRRTVSRILGVFPWYLVVFLSCCSGIFGVLEGNKSGLSLLLFVLLFSWIFNLVEEKNKGG